MKTKEEKKKEKRLYDIEYRKRPGVKENIKTLQKAIQYLTKQ